MTIPTLIATEPHGPEGAPLVVLGPSLGTSTRMWRDAAAALAHHWRVVSWDLPGHGASPACHAPFTVTDLTEGVLAIVDALGEREFIAAGDSLGGATTLELALHAPDRVRAIGAFCTGAKIATEESWAERAALVREQSTSALVVPSATRWFGPNSMAREPEVSGELLHVLRDTDDESYARCCEALAGFDVRSRLSEIEMPVLAVWGEYDHVTDENALGEIANGVQQGVLVEAPDAAHLVPAELPDWTAATFDQFLADAGMRA